MQRIHALQSAPAGCGQVDTNPCHAHTLDTKSPERQNVICNNALLQSVFELERRLNALEGTIRVFSEAVL